MPQPRYPTYTKKEFILRDLLALDRTHLANERTFLAYIRTSLTAFIAGISLIKFFDAWEVKAIGWFFLLLAFVVFVRGFFRQNEIAGGLHELVFMEKKQHSPLPDFLRKLISFLI